MGTGKKAADKVREMKGKLKKKAGHAVGNPRLEAEGQADQTTGGLKQAGQKVKDAFKK